MKAEDVHGSQSGFSSALTVVVSGANNPPNIPGKPSGPNSGNIGSSLTFSTNTTDPDSDTVKYGWDWNGDGTVDEWSGFVSSGATDTRSHIWMTAGTYNVQVIAEDSNGGQSAFSTAKAVTISYNNPPVKPTISGPASGRAGQSYTYYSTTTDPEGDQIYYWFDWADGTNSSWIGPYNSGETVSMSHIWTAQGSYSVKVKAKDVSGLESIWSDPLVVSMPKNKKCIPFGIILAFGFDVDVKVVHLEPGEDYVDLEILSKPFYIWENEIETINSGAFIRLYSAKGLFLPSLPFCFGACQDWGLIG